MAEDSKTDLENEIAFIPIRENLVNTAVNFLLNPNVKNKADHGKVAFLKKKGLSDSEISAAFEKAQSYPGSFPAPTQHDQHSVIPQPMPYYQKKYSLWSSLSSISSSLIVVAVALYGLHRFYKLYIEPWLFGTKPEKDEMKEIVLELKSTLLELKNTVSSLEGAVNNQKEQIDRIFLAEGSPYMPIPMAVADLKTEIASVKSLLINRHQFPAVPKVVSIPSIPLWQLPGCETKNAEVESIPKTDDEALENSSLSDSASLEKGNHKNEKTESSEKMEKLSFDPSESLESIENIANGINGTNDNDCEDTVKTEGGETNESAK